MALKKLVFKPGINRDQTNYANEGGWYECNKVRFFSGFPQKIGGWAQYSTNAFEGVCRALFNWSSSNVGLSGDYLAVGTSSKIYVENYYGNQGYLQNITPLRLTSPSISITSIVTTVASSVIRINTSVAHGGGIGNYVCLSGISASVDGISATVLNSNQGYKILSLPSGSSLTINVGTPALTGGSTTPSGTPLANFEVTIGADSALSGSGWGIPAWGGSTTVPPTGWGVPAVAPVNIPLRLVYFDKYADSAANRDLFFNIRFENIYYWDLTNTYSVATRAKPLQNLAGATDVPLSVTQILFDSNANILMAFGCSPFAGGAAQDPLMVRWASQVDFKNWTPSDDPGISTSGYLRIQNGSRILRALSNANEILVFTESSITSVQFTGSFPLLFAQKLISSDITVIAPNVVTAINNVIYWMGHDKFFMYNGRVEVIPTTLREEVFSNINYTQSEQFFACTNERFNEIWWFYISGNGVEINRYVVYNYIENIWHYGNCDDGMVRTAWVDSSLRPFPQGASSGGYIYDHEDGNSADGQPFEAFITSSDVDIEDGERFSLVRRIIPDVSFNGSEYDPAIGYPSVDMTLYPRNFPGADYMATNQEGQILTRPAISLLVNQYTEQLFVRTRARQIGLKISSNSATTAWQLGAPRVEIRPDGLRGYNGNDATTNTVLWVSQTTDGADIAYAVIAQAPSVVANITEGADVSAALIGVNVTFSAIALFDAGLASSYPGSGSTWYDISGNARHGTLMNSPAFTTTVGGEFNFTPANAGTNNGTYATLPSTIADALCTGSNVTTNGFTVSIWFKINDQFTFAYKGNVADDTLSNAAYSIKYPALIAPAYDSSLAIYPNVGFTIGNAQGNDAYLSGFTSPYPGYVDYNQGAITNVARSFGPRVGYWHNIVFTWNGGNSSTALRLYADGVLCGTAQPAATPLNWDTASHSRILNVGTNRLTGSTIAGEIAKTQYMDGAVAVISVYSPYLSDAQVSALYNYYKPRFPNPTYTPISPAMVSGAVLIYDSEIDKYGEIGNYAATPGNSQLYDKMSTDYAQAYIVYDQSGNNYTGYFNGYQNYTNRVNPITIVDPLNVDTFSSAYNFGGKGTYYTSVRAGLYTAAASGPLNTLLSTDVSFSVNIWFYHTWLGQAERSMCVGAQAVGGGDVWFAIGRVETSDPSNTICAAISNSVAGIWNKTPTFTPSLNTWYQYTMTYDASTREIKFYQNATLVGSTTRTTTARTPSSTKAVVFQSRWDFGALDADYVMRGNWGNCQIYPFVMTAAQVTQNFNRFRGRFGI